MYDVVSEGFEAIKKRLHQNLLRTFELVRDCSTRPTTDWEDTSIVDILPNQEVSIEWYLPLIKSRPLKPGCPEGESSYTTLEDIAEGL